MNIKRHRYSATPSLAILAGLVGLFHVGTANAGSPSDACALLTPQQVASALGAAAVGPGQPIMPGNATVCTWSEQGVPAGTERNVTVSLIKTRSFDIGKTPIAGIPKTPVSGIGDDAYFSEMRSMVASLSVKKGDVCFQISSRSNSKWLKTGKPFAS